MENLNDYQKVEFLRNLNRFYRKILNSVNNPIGEIDISNLGSISTLVSNTIYSILSMTFEVMFNKRAKEIHEKNMKDPEYVESHTKRIYNNNKKTR